MPKKLAKSNGSTDVEQHIAEIVNKHLRAMKPTQWSMEKAPEKAGPAVMAFCDERRQVLIRGANLWCPSNALGNIIRSWVPEFGWAVGNKTNAIGDTSGAIIAQGGNMLIMLVPRELSQNPAIHSFVMMKKTGKSFRSKPMKYPTKYLPHWRYTKSDTAFIIGTTK